MVDLDTIYELLNSIQNVLFYTTFILTAQLGFSVGKFFLRGFIL